MQQEPDQRVAPIDRAKADRKAIYSVVIPVFNSAGIVGETVERTIAVFRGHGLTCEIILINDGSDDDSWSVISDKARLHPEVMAINLLRNYGQHHANLCGFHHSRGDFVITMDDDLQNPPEEIIHLIGKADEGYDLVIGRFRQKKHAPYRRFGTLLIGEINKRIFEKPKDLVLSNFRIIRRDVIDRICAYKTSYPYVPGLCLMFSNHRANVLVNHDERQIGNSNYTISRIFRLVLTILFNYSSYPLRFVGAIGLVVAVFSFALGVYYLAVGLFRGAATPGWLTLVVLLSFFSSLMILILSMLGEYVVRLINQSSSAESFYVKEVVGGDD